MKLYNPAGTVLMTVTALERQDDRLVIRGDIFGSMPITAQLRPNEARAFLKLLSPGKIVFLFGLLFRR